MDSRTAICVVAGSAMFVVSLNDRDTRSRKLSAKLIDNSRAL
jgi:hypothetical protein